MNCRNTNVNTKNIARKSHDLAMEEKDKIISVLKERLTPAGDVIIKQGDKGDSMFLIMRGVVRVSQIQEDGKEKDLATLMAGDFFGEIGLLTGEVRSATCKAVTPCALYELKRKDFETVIVTCPAVQAAVKKVEAKRRKILNKT